MDRLKNAAIVLLGMGEQYAAEILKNMSHKEVEAIIDIMNNIGDISEQEVFDALNEFFDETQHTTGINVASSEYIRNTLVSAVGEDKAEYIIDETCRPEDLNGIELLKWQPVYVIVDALQDEHPQIITVALSSMESEKAAEVLNWFPKDLSKQVVRRMTVLSPVANYAMTTLSEYLEEQFTQTEKFKLITSDGINMAANIIVHLDGETEQEIMSFLTEEDKVLYDKLQDKIFPFEKLTKIDGRGLQTLLAEVENQDLVLALKGAPDTVSRAFYKNMSSKTVDLLKDDMDSLGPVKLEDVEAAQKRIIVLAKKLAQEQKLILPSARGGNTVV